jgi:hypothetical protein
MDASLKTDLESVRGLLASATKYLNELELYPRGRGIFLDGVVLAILSKSIRVGGAICLLVEHDFHSEAFALSRTMLELALYARYISNADSFKRSEMFVKFVAKDREGWAKVLSKYYPAVVPNLHPKHAQMLEIAKEFKDPHRWSGKSVRDLAMEDEAFETLPDGGPFRWGSITKLSTNGLPITCTAQLSPLMSMRRVHGSPSRSELARTTATLIWLFST